MSVLKLQAGGDSAPSSSLTFIFFLTISVTPTSDSPSLSTPGNHLSPGEVRFAESEEKMRLRGRKGGGGGEFSLDAAEEELQ